MYIYDTTLRDGAQGQSVTFSLQDKEQLIRRLDEVGAARNPVLRYTKE